MNIFITEEGGGYQLPLNIFFALLRDSLFSTQIQYQFERICTIIIVLKLYTDHISVDIGRDFESRYQLT